MMKAQVHVSKSSAISGASSSSKENTLLNLSCGKAYIEEEIVSKAFKISSMRYFPSDKIDSFLICLAMLGKKRSKESAGFMRLIRDYKALKGTCRIFYQRAYRLKRIDWKIKSSNPDHPTKLTFVIDKD
nr:hypothetical protein [Tanacetum cinerariifolium]